MSRLLPAPAISGALLAAWAMLNGSLAAGSLLLGALLALSIPIALRAMRPQRPRLARPEVALRLLVVVVFDIVRSGLALSRRILGAEAAIRPRFFWLPLALRDAHAIAALAGIVTMTPGTLSARVAEDRRHLLIHAFDVDDEAALVAEIQRRYEAPLRLIFDDREDAS